jgi:putative ATP-grasp target RiPP
MTVAEIRVHDDPLVTAAERIPQAWPRFGQEVCMRAPSAVGVRPLGLRFAVEVPRGSVSLPPWRYCPDRQMAVGADGEPWFRSLVDATKGTTGPSPDGGPSTGNEEWTPDFMSDETG